MSRIRKNPLTTYAALVALREQGKPQPAILPTHLPINRIKVRKEVFQHRRPAQHASDAHIRELADKAKRRDLDPVTVWWDGKHWNLIDGHHRMEGYMRAGRYQHPIPVEVFEGTPAEALSRAAGANTKDKLQMSTTEKTNAAWRLVVMGETLSKAQQAEAAGVSERLVATMRSAKAKLISSAAPPVTCLSEMTWHQARQEAAGTHSEWTPEDEEVRATEMATALRKALGATAERQPEVFWRALEIYSPQLAKALVTFCMTSDEEAEEELE